MAGIGLPSNRCAGSAEPFDQFPHPHDRRRARPLSLPPESSRIPAAWNIRKKRPAIKLILTRPSSDILTRTADRVPIFENVEVNPKRAWAGLYEMTPDHHPILGESPDVPGFFFANGFSGHGVMHSPATGKILSDLILTGKTDLIEASLLNFSRFAEGRMIHETAVL